MGKAKKTRQVAVKRRLLTSNSTKLANVQTSQQKVKATRKESEKKKEKEQRAEKAGRKIKKGPVGEGGTIDGVAVRRVEKAKSNLFFTYNTQLGPPYHVIIDTNFFHFSLENKIDLHTGLMDCLLAKVVPVVTDCTIAELEKLGPKYRVALKVAKDLRNERYPCNHKGTYADDCIVNRVTNHRCFIVATMDKDLKRRLRQIPGVPIMYITSHRYSIERFPDTTDAPQR